VPVRYIGLGERAEDLREFFAEDFVEALFGKGDEEVAAA
jgi:fused signal recognition particle receptor